MGLFDFLKKKQTPKQPETKPAERPSQDTAEPYLGDLEKTNIIYGLLQTPKAQRNEDWRETFLQHIIHASFRCAEPQVITGPDGFPYFQLFLPEPYQPFQCYVIDRMKDDFLLELGYGVVINPGTDSADWVLSYGDILNLKLNGGFFAKGDYPFASGAGPEIIQEEEQVMIGQPNETLVPHAARKLLANLLQANGIQNPKIMLMMRQQKDGSGAYQDLVFNLTAEQFDSQAHYKNVMQTIGWYLPRHYSYVGMEEKNFGSGFEPLMPT